MGRGADSRAIWDLLGLGKWLDGVRVMRDEGGYGQYLFSSLVGN